MGKARRTATVWNRRMKASDESLVEEVRRYPHLYNSSVRDSKDGRRCSHSWREIAQTLGKDEHACRYRWKYIRDKYVRAKKKAMGECDDADKAPILRTLGWLATHVTHRETANMPPLDIKPEMQAQEELKLQEREVDSQQALGHQEESNQLLRQELSQLQKRLEDKEKKLTEANEIIRALRNEVQTLQQQLELQRREYQDVIGQRAQMSQCIKQIDELKTLDPCMQASSVTSDGHNDLDPNHADTDAERSHQRSREDEEATAQRFPLEAIGVPRTAAFINPPNLFLSCTSEDDPPVDLPVSISDGTVTSSQQEPMRVVTVKLEDCREMLGPNGVYKIPKEDGYHDDEGSCGYDQHDGDDDYDEDNDDDDGGDTDEGDSDYDPKNEGLNILKAHQISCGEKTLNPLSLCESKGQRQRKSHECWECGEVFPSLSRLLVHQIMHRTGKTSERQSRQVKSHECSECGKLFPSPSQLSVHQRVHDKTKALTDTQVETEATVEDSTSDSRQGDCDNMPKDLCEETLKKAQKTRECEECGKTFSTQSSLICHKKLHTGEKTHVCSQCESRFATAGQLRVHLRKKHEQEISYQCPYCPENFIEVSLFKSHKGTHLKCTKCGKVYQSEKKLARHMQYAHARKSCSEKTWQCETCGKIFTSRGGLRQHQKLHTGEKPHVCTQCGRAFALRGSLQAHCKIHAQDRRFECSHCQKRFITRAHLKLHVRRHTGEKPYSCTECGKNFSSSSALMAHRPTHSEERPFLCLQCGYTCKLRSAMTIHESRHARERRKPCPYCNKSFQIYYLKKHIRAHTGERPFKCSECGEAFALRTYLNNHKLRHTGEKPHLCSVCGKAFARQHVLKTHQRVHTGEKPFQCPVCREKFSYIQSLHSHQKREHGDGPSYKCSQCGDGFKTANELKSHECVQGANEETLAEVVEEAVNSL